MNTHLTKFAIFMAILLLVTPPAVTSAGDDGPLAGLKRIDFNGSFHRAIKTRDGFMAIVSGATTRLPGPLDTRVVVLSQEGAEVFARTPGIDVPDAWLVNVMDAALRAPNALVVAAFVRTGQPEAGPLRPSERDAAVLLEYELSTGKLVYAVTTSPIQCRDLVGDSDGTLWCFGIDLQKGNARRHDYDLVHRFDRTGKLLGSSLSRAELPELSSGREPSADLRVARAGFLPGEHSVSLLLPAVRQMITFNPDGSVRDRVTLPEWATPEGATEDFAIGPGGQLIAMLAVPGGTDSRRPWRQRLFRLAPDTTSWVDLGANLQDFRPGVHLVGAERTHLLLWVPEPRGFVWFPVPGSGTSIQVTDAIR